MHYFNTEYIMLTAADGIFYNMALNGGNTEPICGVLASLENPEFRLSNDTKIIEIGQILNPFKATLLSNKVEERFGRHINKMSTSRIATMLLYKLVPMALYRFFEMKMRCGDRPIGPTVSNPR